MEPLSSTGVLLVNLGSPDSADVTDVRKYLAQFLMDKYVMDVSWPLRFLIVYGSILRKRPAESAKAYAAIWEADGSPLILHSRALQKQVASLLPFPVGLAMRYGRPSVSDGINELMAQSNGGLRHLIVAPLYPHYAASSYETAVSEVRRTLKRKRLPLTMTVVPPFYNDEAYIRALQDSMASFLSPEIDHVLFSYHGLPERHLRKADPTAGHCLATPDCCSVASEAHKTCYRHQVFETTRLVVKKLSLPKEKYSVSFQSRLGRDPWLTPYTDVVLRELPKQGVKRLAVVCPAFVSDCLETLEEIKEVGKKTFLDAGGESFVYIPCLNEHPLWVGALAALINQCN